MCSLTNRKNNMIQGLRTVVYPVSNLQVGKEWYSKVLETAPYFDQPFYIGFAVGGFELGLVPDGVPGASEAVAYWGVPNAATELTRLQALHAVVHEALHDVGDGIKVASLLDPFGNVFGIIENPHFDPKAVR
jgi:predicted enzyme related to lactoylglutathione lyase